jgi:integrase
MPRPRPPHLHREETRHGDVVWYVRKEHGPRTRIRAAFATDEFWAEYRAALEGAPGGPGRAKAKPQTLAWGLERYRRSPAWAALATATRRQRENIYRKVVASAAGDALLVDVDTQAIRAGRDRRAAKPHGANNFVKSMRGFFGWAADRDGGNLVPADPTKGVRLLHGPNDEIGHHTWTDEEISRFEGRWPIGTRERLAFDLLLYTGLRRGDVVRLGRQHVRDGVITLRTEKKAGTGIVYPPVLRVLAETIAATKTGDFTFLVTERGTPFVKEGFGNWFGDACRKAGCPGSAHGLRKAGATRAAEKGATVNQLMALFGWSTPKMALHYTLAADRKKLSRSAGELLAPSVRPVAPPAVEATLPTASEVRIENENRPHLESGAGASANARVNSRG